VIAIGARFDDRSASSWLPGYSWNFPQSKLIHVDVDADELGRNYPPDLPILGDARTFLRQLLAELERRPARRGDVLAAWQADIAKWSAAWEEFTRPNFDIHATPIRPERVASGSTAWQSATAKSGLYGVLLAPWWNMVPCSRPPNIPSWIAMSGRIIAAQVREVRRQGVPLAHHDQRRIVPPLRAAEMLCPHSHAKLKRHVEARELVLPQFRARQIVNRPWALADQPPQLVEPDIRGIIILESAARLVPAHHHGEQQCLEGSAIVCVERTVDKDVAINSAQLRRVSGRTPAPPA
jgi:hypothetical protein